MERRHALLHPRHAEVLRQGDETPQEIKTPTIAPTLTLTPTLALPKGGEWIAKNEGMGIG